MSEQKSIKTIGQLRVARSERGLSIVNGDRAILMCDWPQRKGYTDSKLQVFTDEEMEAHARLFAAAPKLLNSCERLLGFCLLEGFPEDHPDIVEARTNIAQATGKE
jgi:hypothetical protein